MPHDMEADVEEMSLDMIDSFPAPFPKEKDTNNYRVLNAVAQEMTDIVGDIERVEIATQILNAETIDELQELAYIVDVHHNTGEALEAFRLRVLVGFNVITAGGTIADLMNAAAFMLSIVPSSMEFEENTTPGVIQLTIPQQAIDDAAIPESELYKVLEQVIAAGYTLEIIADASLEYVTVTEWQNDNFQDEHAKGGLDADGNVITYGTYAGLING